MPQLPTESAVHTNLYTLIREFFAPTVQHLHGHSGNPAGSLRHFLSLDLPLEICRNTRVPCRIADQQASTENVVHTNLYT